MVGGVAGKGGVPRYRAEQVWRSVAGRSQLFADESFAKAGLQRPSGGHAPTAAARAAPRTVDLGGRLDALLSHAGSLPMELPDHLVAADLERYAKEIGALVEVDVGHATGQPLRFDLLTGSMMTPSAATLLMMEHLVIPPGARLIDWGGGTGALGIAAKQLGAGRVTLIDTAYEDPINARIVRDNWSGAFSHDRDLEVCAEDMAQLLPAWAARGPRADVHIMNPPCTPFPPAGSDEIPYYAAGPDGRRYIDPFVRHLRSITTERGVAMFQINSFINPARIIRELKAAGFRVSLSPPIDLPIRPFVDLEYLRGELGAQTLHRSEVSNAESLPDGPFLVGENADGGPSLFERKWMVTAHLAGH